VGIISEWLAELRDVLSDEPVVSEARVGVFYTAVQVSTGSVGVAFTPRDLNDTVCCPKSAAGAPPAGRLIGRKAWELAGYALSPSALRRALGIATLNALSSTALERYGLSQGEMRPNLDALDAVEIRSVDRVVMVGSFVPFIKALKDRVTCLSVVDKHPEALRPDERMLWVAPQRVAEALGSADVVLISGSALVEGGIDDLLGACPKARRRVLAGPTAPLWPATFFRHGIDVLGGIRVADGRELLNIVGQGGSGYFFETAAAKVCIVRTADRVAESLMR
jgi:uncharacterized protein (DUF4213/DUF364 family)